MKNKKNTELKLNKEQQGVAEGSKNVKKKLKKQKDSEDLKKLIVVEDNAVPDIGANVPTKTPKNKKNKIVKNKSTDSKQDSNEKNEKAIAETVKNEIKSVNDTENLPETEPTEKQLKKIEKKKKRKLLLKSKKAEKKLQLKNSSKSPQTSKKVEEVSTKNDSNKTVENDKKSKKILKQKGKVEIDGAQQYLEKTDATTVFIGNLPVNTKRIQLMKLFSKYGPVTGIRFRSANGRKMFKSKQRKEAGTFNAYLRLKDAQTVQEALSLNGTEFKGNLLRVTKVDTNAIREQNELNAKRMIFVGNLKYSANEEKLREIFSSCGEIEYIRCLYIGDAQCKGVAYVCFKSAESVTLAKELNETLLDDRPIQVENYSIKKLNASKKRNEAAAATGALKRLTDKKQIGKKKSKNDSKKKSEYRGVKVDGIAKKKNKNSKLKNKMQELAKKIAPRIKSS